MSWVQIRALPTVNRRCKSADADWRQFREARLGRQRARSRHGRRARG